MGRKRIHPIKDRQSLADRLAFDDEIWDTPDLQVYPSFRYAYTSVQRYRQGIIYKITCLANNREYVGQTITYTVFNGAKQLSRISSHFHELRRGKHEKVSLQRDWDKYGENNFYPSILEMYDERMFVNEYGFKEFINRREIEVMFELNSVYNAQVQSTILEKIAQSLDLKHRSDLMESMSLGEVFTFNPFTGRVELEEYSKDFCRSMRYWMPGIKK